MSRVYKVCMVLCEESGDGDISREESRCELYVATDQEKGYAAFDQMIDKIRGD